MNIDLSEMIGEIIDKNPQFIVQPNYEDLLFKQLITHELFKNYDKPLFMNEVKDILKHLDKERCCNSYEYNTINDSVQAQVIILQNKPQPLQKTPEWYTFRHEHITASNAWKAFGSQAVKNQLIYEKCKSLQILDNSNVETNIKTPNLNESSLTW